MHICERKEMFVSPQSLCEAQALHCREEGKPSRRMNSYYNGYWRLLIDTAGL